MTKDISHQSTPSSLQLAYIAKSQQDKPVVPEPKSEVASFLIQYAFAQFWRSLNVIPAAFTVSDRGAYPAACISGVFSLHDGLKLVKMRGTSDYHQTVSSINYQNAEWELIDAKRETAIFPNLDYWLTLEQQSQKRNSCTPIQLEPTTLSLDCGSPELKNWYDLLAIISRLYIAGVTLDWNNFERAHLKNRTRLRLPTYQFQRKSYWIKNSRRNLTKIATSSILHPLVHQNTSVLTQQSFVSCFNGDEFFLRLRSEAIASHRIFINGTHSSSLIISRLLGYISASPMRFI